MKHNSDALVFLLKRTEGHEISLVISVLLNVGGEQWFTKVLREKENHESLIIIGQRGDGAECNYCMPQKHLKEINM